ncbi:MAG: GNAT family N-acetyltransferase [Clostridia bacterium]|nr:GNAT family N-acetyltransferase [Clostridia bacterium]
MDAFLSACMRLYDMAFPGEPEAFTRAMFDRYAPEYLRTVCENGKPISMLFSIPYPIIIDNATLDARYLYAVATHPDHRGKGLAKQLLLQEAAEHPVFLRPMSESLFDYYGKVGFAPFSPIAIETGEAAAPSGAERLVSTAEFLRLRDSLAPLPHCRPTEQFLSLYENGGGTVAHGSEAVAIFERSNGGILFKEYWGNPVFAPRLAAFLGGKRFELRRAAENGKCFGVGIGVPVGTAFLAALD